MTHVKRLCITASGVVLASLAVLAYGTAAPADSNRPLRARAIVHGFSGSGIEGVITFVERKGNFPEPGVDVKARITGPVDVLLPGPHGMHIHENGVCDETTVPRYSSAGGHFDPGPSSNSNPDGNHPFHMGDIPNLVVDENGVGVLKARTSRITLSPGPLSVFDANSSAVIVHLNPDQGITGAPGSGVSGGPRIACGVIEMVPGDEDDLP